MYQVRKLANSIHMGWALLVFILIACFTIVDLGILSPLLGIRLFVALGMILFAIAYSDWRIKVAVGGFALLIYHTALKDPASLPKFLNFLNMPILLFLLGLMYTMSVLDHIGFFSFIITKLLKLVGESAESLLWIVWICAFLMSAACDEVTAGIVMYKVLASLVNHLNERAGSEEKVSLLTMSIFLVVVLNCGSTALDISNPVSVIVAYQGRLTITDFLHVATPIAIACLLVSIQVIHKIVGKSEVRKLKVLLKDTTSLELDTIVRENKIALWGSTMLFVTVISLIPLHNYLENLWSFPAGTMLIIAAFLGSVGAFTLGILFDRSSQKYIVKVEINRGLIIF